MKEAQGGWRMEVERGKAGRKRENNSNVQAFLDGVMNCQIMYHMKADTTEKLREDEQKSKFNIFKHVFLNQFTPDQTSSSHASSKLPTNETFFDVINSNSQSKEEQEYSKYLKQYQTVVKHSRKNQFRSAQQQNKEMKLLINEFLSDISYSQQNNQSTVKVIPTPTKDNTVKVEKIDLNKFYSYKQNTNKSFATTQEAILETDRQKSNKDSEAVSPRFINVTDVKPKTKKNNSQSKSKEKMQIQVIKVQDLGTKPTKNVTKSSNIAPITIAKKPIAKTQMMSVQDPPKSISLIQPKPQNGYSSSYQKTKITKQSVAPTKVQQQKSSKKPLKIEIQIPLEEVSPDSQASPVLSDLQKSEQFQRQKIIKEVSNAVLNLIRKATTITNKNL